MLVIPELPKNSLVASLQLLYWCIFRPFIWSRFFVRIISPLAGDVALASRPASGTHKSELKNLFRALIWYPFYVAFTIFFVLFLLGQPLEHMLLGVAHGTFLALLVGIAGLFLIGLRFAILLTLLGGTGLGVLAGLPDTMQTTLVSTYVAVFVLGSSAASLALESSREFHRFPFIRQLGSIVIGVAASFLALLVLVGLFYLLGRAMSLLLYFPEAFIFAYAAIAGLICVVLLSAILFQHLRSWRRACAQAAWVSLGIGSLLGIVWWLEEQSDSLPLLDAMFQGLLGGMVNGILLTLIFALPYLLTRYFATPWAGVIAGTLVGGGTYLYVTHWTTGLPLNSLFLFGAIAGGVGLSWRWWLPVVLYLFLTAWNLLLYQAAQRRPEQTGQLFHRLSVCWDEQQFLPLIELDRYLVLLYETLPEQGRPAIEYINTTPQRWAARAAQIELDARHLQGCEDTASISRAHRQLAAGELTGPASSLLRSLSRISQDAEAALSQTSTYNQRLALQMVEERLDGLLRELTRSSERYAGRFQPIVEAWRRCLGEHLKASIQDDSGEIPNPYIIGLPLTAQQAVFVGRQDVSARIEKFLRQNPCPPLLLYGQRRMGKTSLLNNLVHLLPNDIVPLFVDLQGPTSLASDHIGFLYNLARDMQFAAQTVGHELPKLSRDALSPDPFTGFTEWLDEAEHALPGLTLLLTLDEFIALEQAFAEKRLNETMILGFLRHLIQHRSRLKILLSGSHTLNEFSHWAGYLVNVQTIHISHLAADEARRLIEQPIAEFNLGYELAAAAEVMRLTNGHPYLVQLLCAEIVNLKNEQSEKSRYLATMQDVEEVLPEVMENGNFFFADIEHNQIEPEAANILRFIATQADDSITVEQLNAQFDIDVSTRLDRLQQTELLELRDNTIHFKTPLIGSWFAR